jgi:hypothetical protein
MNQLWFVRGDLGNLLFPYLPLHMGEMLQDTFKCEFAHDPLACSY